ncbi:ABC transporter permease [Paenibacillus wynnii]|uniref:ABC transporter permease n=1 Tax=Paenibacillus wynnii TaxID=268407 RepID=UPI0027939C4B|nr:ABC transporter permease [Paenibacillus wynnii]MDQ0192136.1 ABC-2 type transport system permease protein [Paenibacillus wynnii]
MNNILTITWNMVKRTIGSRKGFISYILLPGLVLAGLISLTGGSTEYQSVIMYTNMDQGRAGEHILSELTRIREYKLVEQADEAALKNAVIEQKGISALMIPANYSEGLMAGEGPQISVYELKATEGSILFKMKVSEIADRLEETAAMVGSSSVTTEDRESQFGAVLQKVEEHKVGNVRTDYNLYSKMGLTTITGFTLMFLMGLVTTSVTLIMDDRRQRTMLRMFSAPVRSFEIAIGNFLGSFTVGILQITAMLMFGKWILRYDYGLPILTYFLILSAFMLVSMGIASTIAGMVRNPNNAGMLNMLILTPTCMLGGCFWPISIMPDYMKKAANFVPQKWAIQAVDIASTGGSWNELWLPFAILGLMAAVLLTIGSTILRPSEAGVKA